MLFFINARSHPELKALLAEKYLTEINACQRESERHIKTVARAFIRPVLSKYTEIKPEQLRFKSILAMSCLLTDYKRRG